VTCSLLDTSHSAHERPLAAAPRDRLHRLGLQSDERETRAMRRELPGERGADAARRTGDEDPLTAQLGHIDGGHAATIPPPTTSIERSVDIAPPRPTTAWV
jgi:hypothetical protein